MEKIIEFVLNKILHIINSADVFYGICIGIIIILLIIIFIIIILTLFGFIFNLKKSSEIIQKFGNYEISRIYILRKPLINSYITLLNNYLSLIVELKLPNNIKKWIFIEKNDTSIHLKDYFPIISNDEIILNKLVRKKISLNNLLNTTKQRIGNKKFYNWDIINNNYEHFIKYLLKTLDIKEKKMFTQLTI
jgi:hypothetical protein